MSALWLQKSPTRLSARMRYQPRIEGRVFFFSAIAEVPGRAIPCWVLVSTLRTEIRITIRYFNQINVCKWGEGLLEIRYGGYWGLQATGRRKGPPLLLLFRNNRSTGSGNPRLGTRVDTLGWNMNYNTFILSDKCVEGGGKLLEIRF